MTNAAENDHTAVDPAPALEVDSLRVTFDYPRPAVSDISLRVNRREIVALVGESGSGKTMTARAAIGLLPEHAVATGSVKVDGVEVLNASERDLNAIRGTGVAMIFQEPQTALNPAQTVGWQLRQALRTHQSISRRDARRRAVELLSLVEIPDPEQRVDYYPHQLSGGQKQRVVIALALANDPALLLADEPTTALDVSVQREILDLLLRLRGRIDAGILLITHNLGVVADIADRVVVVQLGEVVGVVGESGSGKTTLGRSIGGLTHLSGGKILVDGHDLDAVDRAQLRSLRHTIAFVPQDPTASLDPRFTVAESIREPLDIQHIGTRAEQSTRVEELLDAVHLPRSFADRLPHELSGGQRQRVALARALSVRPKLLIADEPTSALDVSVQARVLELFAELQHELGFAALFISHDLAVIEQVSDRVYVLRNGQVVGHGSARDVLTRPRDEYTRALLDAVPYPDPQRRRESSAALA